MKQLFILLLIWCHHATGLYAWKCLSLSDADAMSMNNRNINPETYTKKESYQYIRKGLQTNEKKISLDKYSNMAQIRKASISIRKTMANLMTFSFSTKKTTMALKRLKQGNTD